MVEETEDMKEVLNQFEDFQHVFLATMDDDQPRVRPVTMINFDGEFSIERCLGSYLFSKNLLKQLSMK